MEHEDLAISVPGLSGLLMDRWCIQILIVNTQLPFYYMLGEVISTAGPYRMNCCDSYNFMAKLN